MAEHIYLVGFMGGGKSTLSRYISRELSLPRVEMDAELEQRAKKSITQIFHQNGEAYFREMESELLEEITTWHPRVVSCGGGVVLSEKNQQLLKQSGKVVWLKASPATIYYRVKHGKSRPLLEGNLNIEFITQMLREREPYYKSVADLSIYVDFKNKKKLTSEIIRKLGMLEDRK